LPHAKAALVATLRGIAQRHVGIVFHFTHGRETSELPAPSGNFHEYAYVSYADHLPRYDAVVHHAGAGIMNHCLLHGVPTVVLPQDFDQFDNAARLVTAGIAISARKQAELEPAILLALTDEGLKQKCSAMSRVLTGYDATGLITEMVSRA
jgi:UDP:flavonoid glycosyltransferase YjiC (YdhE family)